MSVLKLRFWIYALVVLSSLPITLTHPQDTSELLDKEQLGYRPGKYVPELHGADLGKYVPDYRGQYQHIHVPYDGGYGDRGVKYEHDLRGYIQRQGVPFMLGPRDHLRFMVDFNYNGSGWQVIQFDWIRDGNEDRQYKYVNENKLWDTEPQHHSDVGGYDYGIVGGSGDTNVHIDGEFVPSGNSAGNMQESGQAAQDANDIQDTIRQLLDYLQTNIIPTLT